MSAPVPQERHCFSILVTNEPGVLARVVGLFAGRGYNIDSLTVSEVDADAHTSRINIVTRGTPMVIEQIKHQLGRIVPVRQIANLTETGEALERDLALLKVAVLENQRAEVMKHAEAFKARTLHATRNTLIFEVTGDAHEVDALISLLRPLGLIEISRTGVAGIGRSEKTL